MANFIKTVIRPITNRMRRRRFLFFLDLIKELPRPLTILDIGGTEAYWNQVGLRENDIHIVLLNLEQAPVSNHKVFTSMAGNAISLSDWADQSIDLVFSNSVIEHLFTWANQQKMASEIQRVGKSFFIQTPNYYFPIEPHWLFPFFQFFPQNWRVTLTRMRSWGHMPQHKDLFNAHQLVAEVRLLTATEMNTLFPTASLYYERWLGLKKSISAYKISK